MQLRTWNLFEKSLKKNPLIFDVVMKTEVSRSPHDDRELEMEYEHTTLAVLFVATRDERRVAVLNSKQVMEEYCNLWNIIKARNIVIGEM